MITDRQRVARIAERVAQGEKVALTKVTREQGGYCAQLVREIVEAALHAPWCLAERARTLANARHRIRWAADYERAAHDLGLAHALPPRPGDALFWPYRQGRREYGHAAIYLGLVDGVPSVLENTTARRGKPANGCGPVRVTSLKDCPTPRTVAAVTLASYPANEAELALLASA